MPRNVRIEHPKAPNEGCDSAFKYQRHRPEETLLYQLIEKHYPQFTFQLSEQGKVLPYHVQREFEGYLKCGCLEEGFLRVRCDSCHAEQLVAFSCKRRGFCPSCGARRMAESTSLLVDEILPEKPIRQWVLSFPYPLRFLFAANPVIMGKVLGIVYRAIATHLIKKAGFTKKTAQTGAVTLIQRNGSALNLNIHFHMLFLDGIYIKNNKEIPPRFQWVKAPMSAELTRRSQSIAKRVARYLEHQGLIEQDDENSYLVEAFEPGTMNQLLGHSITYRIALGPNQGRKVFTLQTLPACEPDEVQTNSIGNVAGFSLHVGVSVKAHDRKKLERLCRYITRPSVSEKRLSLTDHGKVCYELKTPYRNGTTHVIFEPIDFIAKLAALVPKPRVNLTRFHGVFAPNNKARAKIVYRKKKKGNEIKVPVELSDQEISQPREGMSWAQRLKRVFNIDIETCSQSGGRVKVIACIKDPVVIKKILKLIQAQIPSTTVKQIPDSRAPPIRSEAELVG